MCEKCDCVSEKDWVAASAVGAIALSYANQSTCIVCSATSFMRAHRIKFDL